MEKFFSKIWNWLNGRKSIISAILMIIIEHDYIKNKFTDPELYDLVWLLALTLFGGSVAHSEHKRFRGKKGNTESGGASKVVSMLLVLLFLSGSSCFAQTSFSRSGGSLKVQEGERIDYYHITTVEIKITSNLLQLYTNGKGKKSYTYTEIVSPAGATLEDKADAIAAFLDAAASATAATSGNQVTQIGHLSSIETNTDELSQIQLNTALKTTVGDGAQTVATAGTAVALAGSTPCKRVTIQADFTNTGDIYVGGSGISSSSGITLAGGDVFELDIDNLNKVYIDSETNGEGVTYTYFN